MIPVRLKMNNFMPYKGETPELSFVGIHTACISGENGSGKSAIIDAITWALWGKTRAKSDDDLVHQNQSDAEVEFEFALGCDLYRIIRKHSKPKTRRTSGKGSLDLYIYNGTSYISISADTKTQTELKISQLLHMDYDTFINSAFLRQGHAGEFSRQTPARRKEVLGAILGLNQYDEYESMAKNRARSAQEERLQLEASISEAISSLEKHGEVKVELSQAEDQLKEISQRLALNREKLERLRTRRQELAALDERRAQIEKDMVRHAADLATWETARIESRGKIVSYQQLTAGQYDIESGYNRLKAARKQDEELSGKARQLYQLKERQGELERAFLQAQAEWNTRHKVTENRVATLEEKAGRLSGLRHEFSTTQPRHQELRIIQDTISKYRTASKEKVAVLAQYTADVAGLRHEIEQIQEKLKLLLAPSDDACCPLCESELGSDRITLVQDKLTRDEAEKKVLIRQLEQSSRGLTTQINQANRDLENAEAEYKVKNNSLVSFEARLSEAIKDASGSESLLASERTELARITESLARRDYAGDIPERLAKIEEAIAETAYDDTLHQGVKAELKELIKFESLGLALEEARRLLPEENARFKKADDMTTEIAGRLAQDRLTHAEYLAKLEVLPGLKLELSQTDAEEQSINTRHREAQQRLGSLQERHSYLEALSAKLKERQCQRSQAQHRQELFEELVLAFGKKGIQAMLIEATLPEIEDEANYLLSRMTDGQMTIAFETQRDTKKGDVAETLDILIADELGMRSYDMYSGGEAFRIDFAIRIALSRLLARRAGAPLPTLIIDEGFGTQDADGIDKLKDAINSIQAEFQKIIVITHIEELKDAFHTRINVTKTADGSKIEISEGDPAPTL